MKKTAISLLLAAAATLPALHAQDASTQLPADAPNTEYTSRTDSLQTALDEANSRLGKIELEDKNKRIWKPGRYSIIGYALQQLGSDFEPVSKSQFAFAMGKGAVYYFPKNALWGCVKAGLDMRWFDMSFAKYKKDKIYSEGWGNLGGDGEETLEGLDLGRTTVHIGAFGFGPNVGVAPFSFSGNKHLQPLRFCLYFHYTPTVGLYMMSEDGETELSAGYCNMFDFGGRITYKAINIGIEGKWGNGKFKKFDFEDDEESLITEGSSDKIRRKFAATRFYIGFTF